MKEKEMKIFLIFERGEINGKIKRKEQRRTNSLQ